MTAPNVPTGPGWWWAKEVGEPEPDDVVVEVRDDDGWGLRVWDGGLPYTLASFHWLAPVATVEEIERLRAEVSRLQDENAQAWAALASEAGAP